MESLILCYPWTTGLNAEDLNKDWPATLYILAGQDQISQNAKAYADSMKEAGIQTDVIEYENAVHSFIESNNDASSSMDEVINSEQESLARQAENQISEWIDELNHYETPKEK